MSTASSILMYGRNPLLLDTRALVLRHAGYRVKALAPGDRPPSTEAVDLLILCHTLTEAERNALLLFAASQRPAPGMLCLTPARGSLEGFTDLFNSFDGPAKLLDAVRKLIVRQQSVQA